MLEQWRMIRAGLGNTTIQRIRQLLRIPFQTAVMATVACGWEFIAEINRSAELARTMLLILPHIALLTVVVLEFFPTFKLRVRKQTITTVVVMIPVIGGAVIHSSFRLGIGLCCCSRSFCPVTLPTGQTPDTVACGLVVNNCYMAFIRKMTHFYGTVSLLAPLTTIVFTTLSCATRQTSGRTHCLAFLDKTRLE